MLSDPEKRATYDKHGVEGLKLKEAMDNMDPSIVLEAFVHSGWEARAAMLCTLVCCSSIFLIFPILLVIKVDTSVAWKWPCVFVPLFICSSIYLCFACLAAVQGEPPGDGSAGSRRFNSMSNRLAVVVSPLLMLIYIALLSVYLENSEGKNFVMVCIPAFLYEAVGLLQLPRELSPTGYQELGACGLHLLKHLAFCLCLSPMPCIDVCCLASCACFVAGQCGVLRSVGAHACGGCAAQQYRGSPAIFPFKSYAEFAIHRVLLAGLRIVQWALLCSQVTARNEAKMSWWRVFLPAWILAGYATLRLVLRFVRMQSAGEQVPHVLRRAVRRLLPACCRPHVVPLACSRRAMLAFLPVHGIALRMPLLLPLR